MPIPGVDRHGNRSSAVLDTAVDDVVLVASDDETQGRLRPHRRRADGRRLLALRSRRRLVNLSSNNNN